MKQSFKGVYILLIGILTLSSSCKDDAIQDEIEDVEAVKPTPTPEPDPEEIVYLLPNIDLTHWKVTLPIGKPTEVYPPAIKDYATNETLKPFFYNDSVNGALVFYAYPATTTANTSYSRTELREQMVSGSDSENWTFKQGGNLKGVLSMAELSKDAKGKYHKVIIMQIHGRLTNAQRDLIGQKDNNAPPMLKIYWDQGKVRVITKILKNVNATDKELLETSSWIDDKGHTFSEYVGFNKFSLEIKVSDGKMEIIFNDNESVIYNDIHKKKWGVFENYFKAGNYLNTIDNDAYSKVKYYELKVSH